MLVNKFKVGDIVEANELTNRRYGYTTKKRWWIGEVVKTREDGNFDAETIFGGGSMVGENYGWLNAKYFDLVKQKPSEKERIKTLELELSTVKERLEALENWRNA